MQSQERQPPVVLLDSSVDDSVDQVLAMAMTLVYTSRQEARLGSISVSRNSLPVTAFSEVMVRFYRGEQPGEPAGRGAVTIGMSELGSAAAPSRMISAALERTAAGGAPLYARTILKLNDTADPVAVIRNALSAQQDQAAVVVLDGPPVNLLGLLAIPEGAQIVQKKVRSLVIGGALTDTAGFTKLLAAWPGPITIASEELRNLAFPSQAIEQDFVWASNHPVVDAYRAAKAMPYDAAVGAMPSVLYAIHPQAEGLRLSGVGTLTVMAGGRAVFNEEAGGRHRMLLADASRQDKLIETIRQVVAAKPGETRRGPRGG